MALSWIMIDFKVDWTITQVDSSIPSTFTDILKYQFAEGCIRKAFDKENPGLARIMCTMMAKRIVGSINYKEHTILFGENSHLTVIKFPAKVIIPTFLDVKKGEFNYTVENGLISHKQITYLNNAEFKIFVTSLTGQEANQLKVLGTGPFIGLQDGSDPSASVASCSNKGTLKVKDP